MTTSVFSKAPKTATATAASATSYSTGAATRPLSFTDTIELNFQPQSVASTFFASVASESITPSSTTSTPAPLSPIPTVGDATTLALSSSLNETTAATRQVLIDQLANISYFLLNGTLGEDEPLSLDGAFGDGNFTNGTAEEIPDRNIFILPWYQQLAWSLIFGLMVLTATGGNLIVIWIVLAHKRMRTVTNYFLVNLSVADTMVSTLNVVFNFIYMLNGDWPFGSYYCKISNFIAILSVGASVFTLMAISIDRYVAIMYPLKPRMSRTMTLNIALGIWFCSSLLSLPNVIFSTTEKEYFSNGDFRVICYMEWPDGPSTKSHYEYIYNVIILLVTYMLPITSMTFTYFRVGRELWGSQSIGEATAKQIESVKSKRKIVKMMIVVVVIFTFCWLPYHIYFILAHHFPEIIDNENVQHIYLAIYWLAMSNSMYNPIIYCWMNSRFRQGFRKVLCCRCFGEDEETKRVGDQRYKATTRFSCSEPSPHDMRVRYTGNGHVSLQAVTDNIQLAATGGSASTVSAPAGSIALHCTSTSDSGSVGQSCLRFSHSSPGKSLTPTDRAKPRESSPNQLHPKYGMRSEML